MFCTKPMRGRSTTTESKSAKSERACEGKAGAAIDRGVIEIGIKKIFYVEEG